MHANDTVSPEPASATSWGGDIAPSSLAVTFVAQVTAGDDAEGYLVQAGARPCRATRATACLLEPAHGDRVACWRIAGADAGDADTIYIVSVLSRPAKHTTARLSLHGDVDWAAPSGALRISAKQSIGLAAPNCRIDAGELEVKASGLRLIATSIDAIASACSATLGQLKLVGAMLSTVFDRELHHAQQHLRTVEGVDRLNAQVIDHQASELLHLQGENLLANGNRLVKVRGTQIHFG